MFSGLFQPMHLIVILGIVLIIWGPGKLPELGEGLAKTIKSFKKTMEDTPTVTPTPIEHQEEKQD